VPTDSDDDAKSDPDSGPGAAAREAAADRSDAVIRAHAERLDRVEPSDVVRSGDPGLRSEVAELRKQLQGYRRTVVLVVPMIVLLLVVLVVVMFTSAPDALPEGSGNGTPTVTVSTTTTTTSSGAPSVRPTPSTTTTSASSTPATVTVTGAAETVAKRIPAPPVFLNGQEDLRTGGIFDFDQGAETDNILSEGDLTHDGEAISGTEGAVLAPGVLADDEYTRCAAVPAAEYESHIRFSEFADNPILCVRTNDGRLAYAELTDFPTSNGGDDMTFRWTVWEK
jgi:hypothetical protein